MNNFSPKKKNKNKNKKIKDFLQTKIDTCLDLYFSVSRMNFSPNGIYLRH